MTFAEKIDKILKANTIGINSPSGLEQYVGVSQGAISKRYAKDENPGLNVTKKIVEKLGINQEWWETGKGEPFGKTPVAPQKNNDDFSYEMFQEIKKNNEVFKEEIDRLWSLVNRLTSTDVKPRHANEAQ